VGGLIEVPELAACLTLNKGDFIRTGARGAAYLAYRKAIQQAVSNQLALWGDVRDSSEQARPKEVRPLERDLTRVLEELARDFPLLGSLVEQRAGGQKRLAFGSRGKTADARSLIAASVMGDGGPEVTGEETKTPAVESAVREPENAAGGSVSETPGHEIALPGKDGARKPAHYGLGIQFEDRDDLEIGRLVESTVWVNSAHPAYRRALASRSIGYHIALAVAMALAPLAVEQAGEHGFVTAFLSRWGEALDRPAPRKRMRR
jgi:hypothetical protein